MSGWNKPNIKVFAFIQARQTSTRFPNKIYQEFNGVPLLYHTISRAKESKFIDDVIVCSPEKLPHLPEGTKSYVHWGDENDVLDRYAGCLVFNPCDYVVRLTSDCPLLDPNLIDFVIYQAITASADYCSNVMKLTFPDGLDTEVIKSSFLKFLGGSVKSRYHREHVTSLIRDNKSLQEEFNCVSIENCEDLSNIKMSVDTKEDLENLRKWDNLRLSRYE